MKNEKENSKVPWWQPGIILFGRMSSWIIGPVLIAIFVGKWLDRKYDTEPWLFLITVGAAFVISMAGIVRDGLKEMRRIEEEEKKKNNADKNAE